MSRSPSPSAEGAVAVPLHQEGVIRQAPRLEAAAPYGAPPLEEEEWSVPAGPEAEDIQELLLELGWQGHPVALWRAVRVLGWLLPSPSEQERISCLLTLCELPYGVQLRMGE